MKCVILKEIILKIFLLLSIKKEYKNDNVWKKELFSELEYNKRLLTLIIDVDKLVEHLTTIKYLTVQKKDEITGFYMKDKRIKMFLKFLMDTQLTDMSLIAAALQHCQQKHASIIIVRIQTILIKLKNIDEICSTSNFTNNCNVQLSNSTAKENNTINCINLHDYCNLSNFQHREISRIVDYGAVAVVYVTKESLTRSKYQL